MAKITLLHGRFRLDEQMDPRRWGFDGPTIYGVSQVERTEQGYVVTFLNKRLYGVARQQTEWEGNRSKLQLLIPIVEDMIACQVDRVELRRRYDIESSSPRAYFGDWFFEPTTFAEKYFHEREFAPLQLRIVGAGDRIRFMRELGSLVRPWAPFAADDLESYDEGSRFNPGDDMRDYDYARHARANPTDKRLAYVWPSLTKDQRLSLLKTVFVAVGLDDWYELWNSAIEQLHPYSSESKRFQAKQDVDLMFEHFRPSLAENTVVDPYIPWLAKNLKKIDEKAAQDFEDDEIPDDLYLEGRRHSDQLIDRLKSSFRAICVWASENRIDLNKVDVETALEEARKYISRAARKQQAESEEKNTVFTFPDGYKVVELKTEKALKYEGDVMKHCVGTYWKQVKAGTSVIYSFRSPEPHEGGHTSLVTLEYDPETKKFEQIYGPQNDEPEDRWKPYMLAIVEELAPTDYRSKLDMGKPPRDVVEEVYALSGPSSSFAGWILNNADLSNMDLTGATFVNCALQGADFTNTVLDGATFTDSNLTNAKMAGAQLNQVEFKRGSLAGVDLEGADLGRAKFVYTKLYGASFNDANLVGTCFMDARLEGSLYEGREFERASFKGAKYGVTKDGDKVFVQYEQYQPVQIYVVKQAASKQYESDVAFFAGIHARLKKAQSYNEGGPTPDDLMQQDITLWPSDFALSTTDKWMAGAVPVRSAYSVPTE